MNNRLFAGFMLAVASVFLVGCTNDNVMQDASQVTNLNEVDLSVFEKTIEDLPTRADDASGTPLSETNLFSELEVALIPTTKLDSLACTVRQLSTDDDFGNAKLYVPEGDYYLVAIAANTKSPAQKHQVVIKSTTEVTFPDGKVTDMAYYYKKVTIDGGKTTTLSVPLNRGVACFFLDGTGKKPDEVTDYKLTLSKGFGKTFNPTTGCCAKEEPVELTYDFSPYVGKSLHLTVYTLLASPDESDAVITGTALDKKGNVVKKITMNGVHMVRGKRTTYRGPLFTGTTGASFTIDQSDIPDVDSGHTFE